MKSASVAVVGATGYTGAELVHQLDVHPTFSPDYLTSQSFVGQSFSEVNPRFSNRVDLKCEKLNIDRLSDFNLVFLALPHGKSMELVPQIDTSKTMVVDLSADYRFDDYRKFEESYDRDHNDPQTNHQAAYGLTEFFQDSIQSADVVACPGCYSTAMLVPLLILQAEGLVHGSVMVDAKSGISGAGRKPKTTNTFVNCNEDIRPYKVAEHRHEPEVQQYLEDGNVTFVPHVIPVDRGIEAALYLNLESEAKANRAVSILRSGCKDRRFFRYREEPAGIKATVRTPYCDISAKAQGASLMVFSCLDNLNKGAATQAIQNANCMTGLAPETGLL